MITIKAVSFNGQPMKAPLGAQFGEAGGVIGRGNGNALVLPDPERFVSRAHAAIAFRAGTYVIRDMSSASPVYVNGIPLGNGREAPLAFGDELRIGAYALQVLPEEMPAAQPAAVPVDDPLDLFGTGAPAARPPSAIAAGAQGAIPEDFDPFADLSRASPGFNELEPQAELTGDVQFGLATGSSQDINQLFGLGASAGGNLFPDGHPLADRAGSESVTDPLVALGSVPPMQQQRSSQRDDVPEIRASFVPPKVYAGNEQKAQQDLIQASDGPVDMVVSWNTQDQEEAPGGIKTMVLRRPVKPQEGAKAPAASAAIDAEPEALEEAEKPSVPAGQDNGEVLLRAFLKGAGVPDLDMGSSLTPEMMQMLGQLLRESTKGTLDLLMARTMTKREMHAQMTVIAMRENNPLKFSPNVEVALHSLLAPRGKGFMPPLQAMKDACDDLRAHQFGVMAGMRAALSRVLQRFDPVQLEQQLTDKTLLDSLLPAHRKGKLWGQYLELYTDITREAEDDFQAWFGREFLSAYEAQMAKLKHDGQQDPAQ